MNKLVGVSRNSKKITFYKTTDRFWWDLLKFGFYFYVRKIWCLKWDWSYSEGQSEILRQWVFKLYIQSLMSTLTTSIYNFHFSFITFINKASFILLIFHIWLLYIWMSERSFISTIPAFSYMLDLLCNRFKRKADTKGLKTCFKRTDYH